jgi:hypothetical protein
MNHNINRNLEALSVHNLARQFNTFRDDLHNYHYGVTLEIDSTDEELAYTHIQYYVQCLVGFTFITGYGKTLSDAWLNLQKKILNAKYGKVAK